jgi:hypothetical protein
VLYESLKEALAADGTPFIEVSDADIVTGELLHTDGSPKYPIVFSLASEAIHNDEITPVLDYVNAGGFLFVGSSAYTRNPDGTTRGDFAFADEMGLHMVNASLENWAMNNTFSKVIDHRIVDHIPSGSLSWRMATTSDDIVWAASGSHHVWQVTAAGAEVIANGASGPLLATQNYGEGRFIYHGPINPLIGHGGYHSGMYAYTIYREAIAWAFEAANLPIIKKSPWRFEYDAAFVIRHDYENTPSRIQGIEASAQYEDSVGAKGDYYFCTGTVRIGSEDTQLSDLEKQEVIESLQRAVDLYGATIASHNGGLPNPNASYPTSAYQYWHWGPDEVLDTDPAQLDGYANGYDYASASIDISFQDIEGWLSGYDNGRPGCGAAANCPRTWVSPYFNSGRNDSYDILDNLGSVTMGEQKLSPFPHWTLDYQTPSARFNHISLPPSDWYIGSSIAQSIESGHNTATVRALIDKYYQLGTLINLYGHSNSTGGIQREYVDYNMSKPRNWAANAVGVYDWWVLREPVVVTPGYSELGDAAIASASISGATDSDTAVEMALPYYQSGAVGNIQVSLDGAPADPADFRLTDYGVKVKVGTTVSNVEVQYTPLAAWVQTNWVGGSGQAIWSDETMYDSASGVDESIDGKLRLPIVSSGDLLFSEDFVRPPGPDPEPFDWITATIPGNYGVFNTIGATLNSSTSPVGHYGYAYTDTLTSDNYIVEADISIPAGSFGGGIFGRLNSSTGERYAIWVYRSTSIVRFVKFTDWDTWVNLGIEAAIDPVGTGWHHLRVIFNGDQIQVYYDGEEKLNFTDADFAAGYTGLDFYTTSNVFGPSYDNFTVRDLSESVLLYDDFGLDAPDPLAPWVVDQGSWTINSEVLEGNSSSGYSYIYYNDEPTWSDYSVQARVQFPSNVFGGGIGGRLDPSTGARYAAWVYPDGSSSGPNILRLIKFTTWTSWSALQVVNLPSVGTGWHTLKLDFQGNQIRAYYDGNLVAQATDSSSPFTSGGISFDTWTSSGATPYAMAADDVEVRSPAEYGTAGTLLSSAFDGGVGVEWLNISWEAAAGGTTGMQIRTRSAARADHLAAASWSDWYPSSGVPVLSANHRWIQYEVELSTADTSITPELYEISVTYVPGILLPGSNLTYTGLAAGDSHTAGNFSATLLDDFDVPIVGRTVEFQLDGLAPVPAITNGSGVASTSTFLSLAPGNYTLTSNFSGDGSYAPVSIQTPYEVTSPWPSWVQETHIDFQGGTGSGVDVDTLPGSVLLESTTVGQGEETGSFSVGGVSGWGYRRALFIDNLESSPLRAGYSVKLVLDTEALVNQSKMRADGDDLRVVWDPDGSNIELDRLAETAFNATDTEIWFKLAEPIAGNQRDSSYYIFYGNPSAGSPPADPTKVWVLWDDFDGTAVDTSIWAQTGTVSVAGGMASLSAGGNLFGTTLFTETLFESNLVLSQQNQASSAWWGWEEIPSGADNGIVYEENTVGLQAWMRSAGGAWDQTDLTTAPDRTDWHTYIVAWSAGKAVWQIDSTTYLTRETGVPSAAMYANLNAQSVALDVDYVKGRYLVGNEPVVSLATPQIGYGSQGTLLSSPYDTGQFSYWRYLVWQATTPTDTNISLRLRTAATEGGLTSASWVDYPQGGVLINNDPGSWIQYEATLNSSDSTLTPELHQVTIYYANTPTAVTVAEFAAVPAPVDILVSWETLVEIDVLGFNIYRSESLEGGMTQLNQELIPSRALGTRHGGVYEYLDSSSTPGVTYYYWLEIIKIDGVSWMEPISVITPYPIYIPVVGRKEVERP